MRILIAYDGTPGSRAVFTDLRRAGLPPKADATVLTVATVGRMPTARALLVEEARLLAQAGLTHVRSAFPEWKIACEVVEGGAATAIVETAARTEADLVVVGTRGLNDAEKSALGSVAREVVTNAKRSVRVARAGGSDGTRLLLGFDGSPGSEDAVAEVCARRWPKGCEIRLLAAQAEASKSRGRLEGVPPGPGADDIGPALDAALRRLEKAGLRPSSAVRIGDARRALLDEAVVWNPDAIFVGGRRLQRLRRFLFGSVAGSVADDAPCTVEVVRPK